MKFPNHFQRLLCTTVFLSLIFITHRTEAQIFKSGELITEAQQYMYPLPYKIDKLDVDNDGDYDVIALLESGLVWYENTQNGSLANKHFISLDLAFANFVSHIEVADMDLDGFEDLVIVHHSTDLSILYNQGNGQFGTPVNLVSGVLQINHVEVADINNDTLPDLLWYYTGLYPDINMKLNQLNGFSATSTLVITHTQNFDVVDFNNDGDLDIVAACSGLTAFKRYTGDGSANFTFFDDYTVSNPYPLGEIEHVDINGDGDLNVFTRIGWKNNAQFVSYQNQNAYQWLMSEDLDSDGDMDVILNAGSTYQACQILENNGTNSPVQHTVTGITSYHGEGVLVDLDNDGLKDLIWANYLGLAWAKRTGNFSFDSTVTVTEQTHIDNHLLVCDMDNDGIDDVVTIDSTAGQHRLLWYKFTSSGTYTQNIIDIGVDPILDYSTGDLNGDGILDILFGENSGLYAYLSGSGTYTLSGPLYTTGGYVQFARCGDLDQDGDDDVYLRVTDYNSSVLLENDGTGVLTSVIAYNLGGSTSAYDVSFADLNGNGYDDIIYRASSGILCTYNFSNWSLATSVTTAIGGSFHDYTVIDFDYDGDLDILTVANFSSNYVNFLENDGFGSFTTSTIGPYLDDPQELVANDFDLDGDVDIFVEDDRNAYLIQNNGTSYQKILLGTMDGPIWLMDFQNDGDMDVVAGDHELFLFKNMTDEPYRIKGEVWYDENQNGIYDPSENPMAQVGIDISPVGTTTFPATGMYDAIITAGTFLVSPIIPPGYSLSSDSASYTVQLTPTNQISTGHDFGLKADSLFVDLMLNITSNGAVCSATSQIWINFGSSGTLSPDLYLRCDVDSTCIISSIYPTPDSVVGNSIYWSSMSNIGIANIQFQNPNFMSMGGTIEHSAYLSDSANFISPNYLFDNSIDTVTCAYDPNDKQADFNGYYAEHFIAGDEEIEYTIRFQNTGNGPATDVRIEDQIDDYLDISTFSFVGSSFPAQITITPTNKVIFQMDNINLPDSGSSYLGSQGFVKYKIQVSPNAGINDEINNAADIFFDFNPPILTNNVRHKIIDCQIISPVSVSADTINVGDTLFMSGSPNYVESYAWSLNSTLLSSNQVLEFVPTIAGTYTITYSASNPLCVFDSAIQVVVLPSNSIIDYSNERISIYPNPANDNISVSGISENFQIEIMTMDGRLILTAQNQTSVNIGNVSSGLYLVRIYDLSGNSLKTERLVISK